MAAARPGPRRRRRQSPSPGRSSSTTSTRSSTRRASFASPRRAASTRCARRCRWRGARSARCASPAAATPWAGSSSAPTRVMIDIRKLNRVLVVRPRARADRGRVGHPVAGAPRATCTPRSSGARESPGPSRRSRPAPTGSPSAAASRPTSTAAGFRCRRSSTTSSRSSSSPRAATSCNCSREREPRALPARDRRLRPVRLHLFRHPAPRAAAQARSAWSRCATSPGSPAPSRSASARAITYGDFQYAIDEKSDDFLRRGVFCVLPPGRGRPADAVAAARARRRRLDRASLPRAHQQERGLQALRRATTSRPTGRSTGPTSTR